jgi:hypothetical protein
LGPEPDPFQNSYGTFILVKVFYRYLTAGLRSFFFQYFTDPDLESQESTNPEDNEIVASSFVDPGCLFRIQKQQQKRGVKKFFPTFFVATNITKLKIIIFLNWRRKKFGPIYKEL